MEAKARPQRHVDGRNKDDTSGRQPNRVTSEWDPLLRMLSRTGLGPRSDGLQEAWTPRFPKKHVEIELAGTKHWFSSLLLRDMCDCPQCVDISSKQKLFSTVDIPHEIHPSRPPTAEGGKIRMTWNNDVPGYDSRHESTFDTGLLRRLASVSDPNPAATTLPQRVLWSAEQQRAAVPDVNHEAYMSDDSTLHKALLTLHTHGLLFLTKVPEQQTSVSAIAERIGPLKTTFYGSTWDVRSVPQAKNVAYTAQDLGFHMDLLYMRQPPHLQFLHCIRSSSAGGASLFTDSFRAAQDLWHQDPAAFLLLTKLRAGFHYNHPDSHYYQCSHSTIDLQPPGARGPTADILKTLVHSHDVGLDIARTTRGNVKDWLHSVAWAPPFQAPFNEAVTNGSVPTLRRVNSTVHRWHTAAMKFNALIHKPEGIYERMMKPGECVIFDNRRVLHGRRAFEVEDAGKERWLRGAYLDLDPYLSKLRVLGRKFGSSTVPGESSMAQDVEIG